MKVIIQSEYGYFYSEHGTISHNLEITLQIKSNQDFKKG